MTALEAKYCLVIERKILGLIGTLPSTPDKFHRVSFQIARIAELERFIINRTLADQSVQSEAEVGSVPEPAPLVEREPNEA